MTQTVAVLGTFETAAENSEIVARHIEGAGARAIRIHRDEPWANKVRKMLPAQVVYGAGFGFAAKMWATARLLGKRTINHWAGTDVLLALEDARMAAMAQRAKRFVGQHLAWAPWLADELAMIGISARALTVVTPIRYEQRDRPAPPAVLTYLPDARADFYGAQVVYALARRFPDVPFAVVAGTQEKQPAMPNITYLGWVTGMAPLYEQYPILLRVARHDGLPKMVLEALACGNQVIFEYPFAGCWHARTEEEASAALGQIIAAGCPINRPGHEFVAQHYDAEQLVAALLREIGVVQA